MWTWTDLKYALAKRGLSLASLARASGVSRQAMSAVRRKRSRRLEAVLAAALDERPETIWPRRYSEIGESDDR